MRQAGGAVSGRADMHFHNHCAGGVLFYFSEGLYSSVGTRALSASTSRNLPQHLLLTE